MSLTNVPARRVEDIEDAERIIREHRRALSELQTSVRALESAAGRFENHRLMRAVPTFGSDVVLTYDASTNNDNGWILVSGDCYLDRLTVAADANVSADSYRFHVERSTDGGDTFNDFWGEAGDPVVSLTTNDPEIAHTEAEANKYACERGDILRVRCNDNSSGGAGPSRVHASLRVVLT